jgi:hypothetical protein
MIFPSNTPRKAAGRFFISSNFFVKIKTAGLQRAPSGQKKGYEQSRNPLKNETERIQAAFSVYDAVKKKGRLLRADP